MTMFRYNPRKRKATYTTSLGKRQKYTTIRGVPTRFAVPPKKVELKYQDGQATTTIPTGGSVILCTEISNGTGPSDRIGRRIQYHDIQINYHWSPAIGSTQRARAVLVYDTQSNNALPLVTEVMNGTDVAALYNPDNRMRFKILYDTMVMTHQSANFFSSTGEYGKNNVVISLKGKDCLYSGSTSTVSDIEKGSVFWVLLGNVNNGMTFVERQRLQYFDQ